MLDLDAYYLFDCSVQSKLEQRRSMQPWISSILSALATILINRKQSTPYNTTGGEHWTWQDGDANITGDSFAETIQAWENSQNLRLQFLLFQQWPTTEPQKHQHQYNTSWGSSQYTVNYNSKLKEQYEAEENDSWASKTIFWINDVSRWESEHCWTAEKGLRRFTDIFQM